MKNFLVECTDPHGKEKTMRFDYEENCTIKQVKKRRNYNDKLYR